MAKVSLQTYRLTKKEVWRNKNLTQVVISNLSSKECIFFHNGQKRTLPPFDAVNNVPVAPFAISDYGNWFDLELNFNQAENNVIIDYTVLVSEIEKC